MLTQCQALVRHRAPRRYRLNGLAPPSTGDPHAHLGVLLRDPARHNGREPLPRFSPISRARLPCPLWGGQGRFKKSDARARWHQSTVPVDALRRHAEGSQTPLSASGSTTMNVASLHLGKRHQQQQPALNLPLPWCAAVAGAVLLNYEEPLKRCILRRHFCEMSAQFGCKPNCHVKSKTRLSARDGRTNRVNLRIACASVTFGGIGCVHPDRCSPDGNQTHDEHLIPADEQWSYRREQLASSGRCPTETN